MKVICGICKKSQTGRYWKLKKEGWLVVFIRGHENVVRCPEHYHEDVKKEIHRKFKELKLLHKL